MDSIGDLCERKCNRDFPVILIFLISFFIYLLGAYYDW